ncbi:MAG TPA: copper oxidase, partial [Vicinamibacteria bacterium]|nr:copper oxidase [Vicinamibacteria bacterium]
MITRRRLLSGSALAAGGTGLLGRLTSAFGATREAGPTRTTGGYTPVITPDGATLPYVMTGHVK